MLVAFKLKNSIYDMFQHFRSCNTSFLINVSDQQYRRMRFFRKTKNGRRTLSDLRYTSGRRFDTFGGNSLYTEVSIREGALTPGLDFSAYPRAYSISFGINLGF